MECKELKKAIRNAYLSQAAANCYLCKVNRLLVCRGFGDERPQASICAGQEFIVVHQFREITIEEAVDIIARRGYLLPSDFKL